MKKATILLVMALVVLVSCEKEEDDKAKTGETKSISIDATSNSTWHYYSFSDEALVGTGEEDSTSNASWFARDDWDIAVKRYLVRTNSGDATTINALGGVYTCDESIEFSSLDEMPEGAFFESDETITKNGHGGTTYDIILSSAQVIQFKKNPDGSLVMPPVYLPSPVYVFKTADGEDTYKLNFTQYTNDDGDTGYVEFDVAQLY